MSDTKFVPVHIFNFSDQQGTVELNYNKMERHLRWIKIYFCVNIPEISFVNNVRTLLTKKLIEIFGFSFVSSVRT